MPANRDPNSVVQFYFGNAARDLGHLLPPEEEGTELAQLHYQLDEIELLTSEIESTHQHLSFLLRDVSYFIKGK
jgi:hypothetical protein